MKANDIEHLKELEAAERASGHHACGRAWRRHWCSQPTERDRHSRQRGESLVYAGDWRRCEAEKDKQLSSVVKCALQQRSMVLSPLLLGCRSTGAVAHMPSWIDVRYHRPKVTCSQIRYLQCKHGLWTDT